MCDITMQLRLKIGKYIEVSTIRHFSPCYNRIYVLVFTHEGAIPNIMITLDKVRDAAGLTIDEAAECCMVSAEEMIKLENDPGLMPASMVIKLRKAYGFPIDYVSI